MFFPFDVLLGISAEQQKKKQELINRKKGKTNDQKDVIDYFLVDNNGCGCLGGKSSSTLKAEQYIAKVHARLQSLAVKQNALAKLGIDESEVSDVEPIFLHNFVFNLKDENLFYRFEKSAVVTSQYSFTWIFFSKTEMFVYTYTFDMTSDDTTERMREFFLQDITCFETEQCLVENIDKNLTGCFKTKETVTKNNYMVDSFKVVVPGDKYIVSMRNAGAQANSVMAAKALLRDRKYSK